MNTKINITQHHTTSHYPSDIYDMCSSDRKHRLGTPSNNILAGSY